MVEERGKTPAEYLDSLDFLSERVVAAHCTHLANSDLEILERKGVSVAHNPAANHKLGSGIADVPEMRTEG